ncbi:hypothetical protein HDU85_001144 [Gaertneriomyces sp. JEL0708]|nr:hypothetical protein HDU85_001144 [Gaertneriomyces sp. JEL0708]
MVLSYYTSDVENDQSRQMNASNIEPKSEWLGRSKSQRRRYCNGRLSRCQFITAVCLGTFFALMGITFLLVYLVIGPNIIKGTFATAEFGGGGKELQLELLNLKQFTDAGVDLQVKAGVTNTKLPQSFLFGGLEPATFDVSDESGKLIQIVLSDGVTINGKEDLKFSQETLSVNFPQPDSTKNLIGSVLGGLSNANSASAPSEKTFVITGTASINIMGLVFKNLDLRREQKVDIVAVSKMIDGILGGSNSTATDSPSSSPSASSVASLIDLAGGLQKRDTPGPGISLNDLAVQVTSQQISASTSGAFGGQQPIRLALDSLSLTARLASIPLVEISLANVKVDNTFQVALGIVPLIPTDPTALGAAVERVIKGDLAGIKAGLGNLTLRDANGKSVGWLNTVLAGVDIERDLSSLQSGLMTLSTLGGGGSGSASSLTEQFKLNNLDVDANSNNTLTIRPKISLKAPFPAKVDIQPITIQLQSPEDKTAFVAVALPAINLDSTQNDQVDLDLGVSITFDNSPVAQTAISGIAQKFVNGLDSAIRIGGITIGDKTPTAQSVNTLTTLLAFTVPLQLANSATTSNEGNSTDAAGVGSESIISSFNLGNASFALTETGFDLGAFTSLNLTLPVRVNLPFAALRVGVDEKDLAGFQMENFTLAQGFQDVILALNGRLSNDPETGNKLNSIFSELFAESDTGNKTTSKLVFQGFQFGRSSAEAVTLFDKLNVAIPTSLVKPFVAGIGGNAGSSSPTPSNSPFGNISISSINPKLNSASLTTTGSGINIASNAGFTVPLPLSVSAPFLGVDVLVQNARAISLNIEGIRFTPGTNNIDIAIATTFSNEEGAATAMSDVVSTVLGQSNNGKVAVSGFRFGSSAQNVNSVFGGLRIDLPISALASGTAQTPGAGTGFDIKTVFPNATLDVNTLKPQIQSLDISALANGFSVGPVLTVNNPLPVAFTMPFASVSLLSGDAQLITTSLKGLQFVPGANTIPLTVAAGFGLEPAVADAFAGLFDAFTNNKTLPKMSVTGIKFGASETDNIATLQKVTLDLPVDVLQRATGGGTGGLSLETVFPPLKNISLASLAPTLRNADVSTTDAGIQVGVRVGVDNSLPVTVNLGHLGADISLAQSKFSTFALSNMVLQRGPTDIAPTVSLAFGRDEALAAEVSKVIQAVTAGTGGNVQVNVAGVTFGADAQNPVTAFSKISLPLALPLPTGSSGASGLPIAIATNGTFALQKLERVGLRTTDQGIAAGLGASINNPFPVSVNLGFISVGVSTQGGDTISQVSLTNTTVGQGVGPLALAVNAALGQGANVAQGVAALVKDITSKQPSSVRVNQVSFGASQATAFTFLSGIDLPVPIALPGSGGNATSTGLPSFEGLAPKLASLDVRTTADGIAATIEATIGNLPIPINIDLGFAAVDLQVEATKLTTLSVERIGVTNGNAINVPVNLQMLPMSNQLPAIVAGIANPLLAKQPLPKAVNVGAAKILFGPSREKTFDLLSLVDFSTAIAPETITGIISQGAPSGNSTGAAGGLALTSAKLATTATGFAAAATAQLPLQKMSALLGSASASILLDDTALSTLQIGKTQLENTGVASTAVDIVLDQSQAAQDKVGQIVNPLIASLLGGGNATVNSVAKVTGITFGGEGAAANPLLSQVVFAMPLAHLVAGAGGSPANPTNPGGTPPSPLPLNASIALDLVPTGIQGTVSVQPLSNLPIELDIGDFKAALDLGGEKFCDVNVNNIRFAPARKGEVAIDVQLAVKPNIYPKLVTDLLAKKANIINVGSLSVGQPASPLSILSAIKAPVKVLGNGLPAPSIDIIPPSATFNLNIPVPLTFNMGAAKVDAMLGRSRAATINVEKLNLSPGPNEVKAGIDISLLGGITGLPQILLGGKIAGANLDIQGPRGAVTWINQSFQNQLIEIGGLLGSKNLASGFVANTNHTDVIKMFNWGATTRAQLEAVQDDPIRLAELLGLPLPAAIDRSTSPASAA